MNKFFAWCSRCLPNFRLALILAGLLVGMLSYGNSIAATFSSAQSGNWNAGTTWVGGVAPATGDKVTILIGHTVTVTANAFADEVIVNAGGTLRGDGVSAWIFTYGKGGGEDFTVNGTLDFGAGRAVTLLLNKNSLWGGAGTWNLSQFNYANRTLTLVGAVTPVAQVNFSGNAVPITGTTGAVTSLPATIWNFTGTTAQTLPATANVRFGSIQASNTTTVTLGIALNTANLQGNLTVQSGTLANGGFAIDGGAVAGKTFSVANGATFLLTGTSTMVTNFPTRVFGSTLPTCSTVNYGGSSQTVSNELYGNLVLSNTGTKTMPGTAMTVACDFSMSGSAVATTGNSISVGRDFIISGSAVANMNNPITVGRDFTMSGGTLTAASGITVTRNMTLDGTSVFTAGTFTHNVGGNFTNNGATFTRGTSTINMNGTAAQTIGGTSTTTFNNLIIANTAAVVSAVTNFNTNGTLTVNTNAILSPTAAVIVGGTGTLTGTGTVQVTSTAAGAGGFSTQYTIANKTMTNLTVEYIGASAQTVSVITYGSATGGGLKINNGSGVTLTANTTVAGTLNLLNGKVNASTFTLLATGDCTTKVLRTNGWVIGKLQLSFPAGSPTCTYPIGDATNYYPIVQAYASVSIAGVMVGSQTAGDHPNIATSGLDATKSVNRYWTLTKPTGSAIVYTTYDATFTFVAADYDVGATPANFEVEASLAGGATWIITGIGTRSATTTQATGIAVPSTANTYYDFAVAEKKVTTPGGFVAYDTTTTPSTAIIGNLKIKIAGAAFTFDIGALNVAKTALFTTFAGTVKVELLDSSDNTGVLSATTACRDTWTSVIQTLTDQTFNAAGDLAITGASGRHRVTPTVTENNSWKDVRVRVSYPVVSPTVIGCSTDNFAIRPNSLTVSVTDATWDTAGITRALSNVADTGGNVHKAGQSFTIRATGYNAAGTPAITSNYNGTPTLQTLSCTLPSPGCVNGILTPGVWSASGGVITTTTASYSEAGAFDLTLQDRIYAAVDSGDGSLADCTTSGYYICPAAALPVGRFVPDHFDVTTSNTPQFQTFNTTNASCSAGGRSFTYIGQPFWYQTLPQATVTARNLAGATTTNYKGTLWKIAATDITQTYSNNAVGPALDTSLLIGSPTVTDNSNGTGTVTPSATDKLGYQRDNTTPIAPFSANLSLAVSAQDASENVANQGIINSTAAVTFNGAGAGIAFDAGNTFRYGRLKLSNAHGSELLRLPIPLQTQYWDGIEFITNTSDNCTSLVSGNIGISTTLAGITATLGGAFVSGVGSLTLSKSSARGFATVCVDLGTDPGVGTTCTATSASRSYLKGLWAPGTNYDNDPQVRATYGVYKGANEFIYLRENY